MVTTHWRNLPDLQSGKEKKKKERKQGNRLLSGRNTIY